MPLYELFRSFSNSELEMIEEQVFRTGCELPQGSARYAHMVLLMSCVNDARRYWDAI